MEGSGGEGRESEERLAGRLGEVADEERARGKAGGHESLKGLQHLKRTCSQYYYLAAEPEPVGCTHLSMTCFLLVFNYLSAVSLALYLLYGK